MGLYADGSPDKGSSGIRFVDCEAYYLQRYFLAKTIEKACKSCFTLEGVDHRSINLWLRATKILNLSASFIKRQFLCSVVLPHSRECVVFVGKRSECNMWTGDMVKRVMMCHLHARGIRYYA